MTVSLLILRIKFVFFYNPTLFYEQLLHFTIDELTSFEILAILLIQYILYSTGLGIRSMVFRANRSFFVSKRATGGNRLWLRFCKERREQIAHVTLFEKTVKDMVKSTNS